MRRGLLLSLVLAVAYLGLAPSPIEPLAWTPPPSPGLVAPFADNAALSALELLTIPTGHGPETIVAGPDDWLYTGLKGGRIIRFRPDGSGMEDYADTGGRPNGLAFDSRGHLIVADSFRGLLSIAPNGHVSVLTASADGQDFVFNDGVDIAADGTIWFTDGSARFPDGQFHYDMLEGAPTGRLLSYDPVSGETRTRLANLRFPNGIALGPDDDFVLVNETLGYRTLRHWITGPRAGRTDTFGPTYPGLPDDIRYDGRGLFWVALAAERLAIVDWLQPYPAAKSLAAKVIGPFVPDTDARWMGSGAFVIALDLDGHVVHNLQDRERRFVTSTGVLAHGGFLYVGSVAMDAIGRLPVPGGGRVPAAASGRDALHPE
jgi:sugar lactone lactonase YvrE